MATKPDLAQKLINDLRLRKERMATAKNTGTSSFVPADAFRNSRQILRGSREKKTLQPVGPKIGSKYNSTSTSHKYPTTAKAMNQIVPYGGGHHTGERGDLSMALAYAFDNGGKVKRIDFTGSGTMMDFLQQIGRRSMQQSSHTQWSSMNQFPTLTHLHVDEIARGAQKLNQILRACSNGLNIDKGTVEIGKKLWKGAIELEQSLRMLVSLQEASENIISPRRKGRLKLLEEGEDEEENSNSSTEKQKQVQRPVFSFDKPSKNKGITQTSMQQKLMALTYIKEDQHLRHERQEFMTSECTFNKRSDNCSPEFHASHRRNSPQQTHDTGIPNIIAKLMGLEELSQKVDPKADTERGKFSKQNSGDISTGISKEISKATEIRIEYPNGVQDNQNSKQNNKIAIVKYHKPGLQQEAFRLTYDYSYTAMAHSHKPIWNGARKANSNDVNESHEAISKINELKSHATQPNRNSSSKKDIRKETTFSTTQRKQHEVKDSTETLRPVVPVKNQNPEAAEKVHAGKLGNWNSHKEKRATNTPIFPQKKTKHESKQVLTEHETQGKNLESKDGSQQMTKNMSEQRKPEAKSKRMQKQPPTKHSNSTKENNAEAKGLTASKVLLSESQKKEPVGEDKATNSEIKPKSSVNQEQKSTSTNGISRPRKTQVRSITSDIDAKPAHMPVKKVVHEIKLPKLASSTTTNEVFTRAVKKAKKIARVIKPHISIPEASQTINSKSKLTQTTQPNAKPGAQASQQTDTEQMITTKPVRHELQQSQEEMIELPPNEKSQSTKTSKDSDNQHNQGVIPDEVQEVKPQRTATDIHGGNRDIPCDLQLEKMVSTKLEKQKPLTEDEMYLKQKLITSHLFLNTAEALFKLNIPIGTLNYAIDQVCQDIDNKFIIDCGYEVLKRKGRRQEVLLHPHNNTFKSGKRAKTLDDLVRQLHKEFESLRSYGRNGMREYDDADYILSMLGRDIHYRDPNINSMWELGWNEEMFAYVEMDEVIKDIDQTILDELINEMADECVLKIDK